MMGGSTPFTATITFENLKDKTATITSLTMSGGWTGTQPTWTSSLVINPGQTGTIKLTGSIPAGETGDRAVALIGIVGFDGSEYKITWFNAATLRVKSAMIPGFPAESIALGLLGAIIVLFAKRAIRLPKPSLQ